MLPRPLFTWALVTGGVHRTEQVGDIVADGVTMAAGLIEEAGVMPVGNTADTALVGDTVVGAAEPQGLLFHRKPKRKFRLFFVSW